MRFRVSHSWAIGIDMRSHWFNRKCEGNVNVTKDHGMLQVGIGKHRRVKRARNGPKMEKMGQHGKSTRPGLPYTGRPHGHADHTPVSIWQARAWLEVIAHGHVPTEPKLSPIRKRLILRALRHSEAYKYTLEEEKMGAYRIGSKELLQESRLIHLRSRIHHQD
ncbi:Mannonate dehydratase [Gossypium arboreum]|uniref:Mannonate dehydratase n=1 Tax=Gossypium arboreum TaxID=29729 RepID=A0A0B0MS51_GOSAR|nr:Mannonate dehydratase [Gossypium arboreum]